MLTHRVLVIEDDPILRRGMKVLIGASGAEVLQAETVAGAIECLEAAPSHILLDLNLPDGCGIDVLRHIRDNHLPIRVAVVSGSSDMPPGADMQALTPDATFRKPAEWDAVLQWLATT
jgi:DNA-binding NarL/FixJ family response regulator